MIEDDINMAAVAGNVATGDAIHLSDVERVGLRGEGRNRKEERGQEWRGPAGNEVGHFFRHCHT